MLAQTFQDWELIVGDDASTDETSAVVASFTDPRIRYVRASQNLGIYGNWNSLIPLCRGEHIAIYHDHDVYLPTIVEKCCALLESNPGVVFVHTGAVLLGTEHQPVALVLHDFDTIMDGNAFQRVHIKRSHIIAATAMVRRRAYEMVGPYDAGYGMPADAEMWLRLAEYGHVGYIREPLALILSRDSAYAAAMLPEELRGHQLMNRDWIPRIYGSNAGAWGGTLAIQADHQLSILRAAMRAAIYLPEERFTKTVAELAVLAVPPLSQFLALSGASALLREVLQKMGTPLNELKLGSRRQSARHYCLSHDAIRAALGWKPPVPPANEAARRRSLMITGPGGEVPIMPEMSRPTILILIGAYLPGYKAGGPIRSIANLVETFGDEFAFRIITSDRDHRGKSPYRGVTTHEWVRVGKADVMYLPPRLASVPSMIRVIHQADPDVLYINSLFSPLYSIVPMLLRWLKLIRPKTVLLAPRGELSAGALRLKMWKKFPFQRVAQSIGLHRSVLWHASTQYEARDILAHFFGSDVAVAEPLPVRTACDLPDRPAAGSHLSTRSRKAAGCLRVVFLSRISRKKNLDGALSMLGGLRGDVLFSIYGPAEDAGYWEQCREAMQSLPANVRVEYRGEVPHDRVAGCLAQNDLFFLPTHGENYGHVIAEALAAGCPVLISDQTPWRNLEEKGVGWDLPLASPERFRAALQRCIDMEPDEFQEFSDRARRFAMQHSSDSEIIRSNLDLLNFAVCYPRTADLGTEQHSI